VNPVIIFAVFFGGGLGSVMRHFGILLARNLFGDQFPYGTMIVNIFGCFTIGLLMEFFALKISQPAQVQALLVTGFLGGFTTFSAFSFDFYKLVGTDQYVPAALYVAGSVFISLIAVFGGAYLVRAMVG
jgi:CrcB protein